MEKSKADEMINAFWSEWLGDHYDDDGTTKEYAFSELMKLFLAGAAAQKEADLAAINTISAIYPPGESGEDEYQDGFDLCIERVKAAIRDIEIGVDNGQE